MAETENSPNLLETMEEDENEVQGAHQTWCGQGQGLGMGKYEKIVLAHSQQLDTCRDVEQ